jgi:Na+/H+-dicarboxylate symporter
VLFSLIAGVFGIGNIELLGRLLDMILTAVNVSGDAVVTFIVSKSEGKLDLAVYNDPEAGKLGTSDIHIDQSVEDEIVAVIESTHSKT